MSRSRKTPGRHEAHYLTRIDQVIQLKPEDRERLHSVTDRFIFRANDYYLSLIDWNDPNDPIRRLIVPHPDELIEWGHLDPSMESEYTPLPGLEHKYDSVAVILATSCCGGYCRFCFRKRIYMKGRRETLRDFPAALEYIRSHPEISEALLTGGDPLILDSARLDAMIGAIRKIPHIGIIRIGSKLPAFNPFRILEDPDLIQVLKQYSAPRRRIYIMAHFNHPRELTSPAIACLHLLMKAGLSVVNQTPLIRGVNDSPDTLIALFKKLSAAGVPPYYVFQCRPAVGNRPFVVPIEEGYRIFETAKGRCSGLTKRARFVMSHHLGKIEVVGLTDSEVIFKFHRAHRKENCSRIMTYRRNPEACWLDDYTRMTGDHPLDSLD